MSTISLHKYHDQINLLLEDNQYSLAASHCRYILQQHPRHVDTYRLLAKTLIEQGDFSGATQLFQRVLCADPNDYIAHAGLSVVYREGDVLSQALWHLERAFEIEPYNSAIQQELRVLYAEFSDQKLKQKRGDAKGNEVPDSLPLTQGALARLYIQGELYVQAIDVLRGALAEDGDRIDLEVLLAEALWRDNQRMAAVQICLQVLEKLPNCITANAILAEIWLQTGRTDEAKQYLENLQALTLLDIACQDLDSPEGSAFQPEGAIALPAVFEVNRMGDDDMASLMDSAVVGSSSEDGAVALEEGDAYQWLDGLGDDLEVDGADISPSLPLTTTDSDWLRRELGASDGETAVSDDLSDWLTDLTETDSEDESGIDTFGKLAAGAVAAGVIGKQLADDDADYDEFAALAGSGEEDSFDWFSEGSVADAVTEENGTVFAQMERAEEAEEMPDWLADMSGDALEPVQVNPLDISGYLRNGEETDYLSGSDDAEEDIYDWLKIEEADDDETADELSAGDLDLSQFAEFGKEKVDTEDDEEIVWRLTDELNPLVEESVETGEAKEVGKADLEILPDETGELGDIPDWLVGSRGMDELDAASMGESAGNEVADELAEWVAANQPDALENSDLSDWLSEEPAVSDASDASDTDFDEEEEDDFFSSELPSWMIDAPKDLADSAPLISEPLSAEEITAEADLPDWLMGGSMGVDDSGLLDTGAFANETGELGAIAAAPEPDDDLPDWLIADVVGGETQASDDEGLLDWLSGEDEDDHSGTAVVGGLLGAMAAGVIAKGLLDDDDEDEDHPEMLVIDSGLEHEVTEDAVSDRQDDLIGPQDEPEKVDAKAQKDSDQFDWLDDLSGPSSSAKKESLPMTDLSDGLDWLNLDEDGGTDDLNLDALLGLKIVEDTVEEKAPEAEIEPDAVGLADDESLDWLDALSGNGPEAIDEMPTWQWPEDEAAPDLADMALPATDTEAVSEKAGVEEWGDLFSDETAEEDVVEDLDDAMAWLENLAAEPDAPVEELPSVAEDMDLDSLFAAESDLDSFDFMSGESVQTETLDEIFAVDTQNDSWLEGLTDGKDPLPDFLEEDEEFDFEELVAKTAVISETNEPLEAKDDVGEPPEDLDDAMAWLEQLAARQGAPLDELPSVEKLPAEQDDEGMGVGKVIAGAAALGALGAVFADDGDDEIEPAPEPVAEAVEFAGTGDQFNAEEDLLALEMPDDPDEAMAWLENLAAESDAPAEELPSASEDMDLDSLFAAESDLDSFDFMSGESVQTETLDEIFAVDTQNDSWLEGLTGGKDPLPDFLEDDEEFDFEELVAETAVISETNEPLEAIDDVGEPPEDLDDAMAWLEQLAARQGAPLDELPSVEKPPAEQDDEGMGVGKVIAGAAALGALGAVFADDDDEIEPAPEPVAGAIEFLGIDDDFMAEEDVLALEVPDDPDEAMAWLERLAARQGAPLDELPSVSEYEEIPAEFVVAAADDNWLDIDSDEPALDNLLAKPEEASHLTEVEDDSFGDLDDTMAWLEGLGADEDVTETSAKTATSEFGELIDFGDEGLDLFEFEDEPAPVKTETPAALKTIDLSDDLDWLESVTGSGEAVPAYNAADVSVSDDELADALEKLTLLTALGVVAGVVVADKEDVEVAEVVEETAVSAPETTLDTPADDFIDEMPDDPDEAMAWLEKLAARQGAPLDELPSVAKDEYDDLAAAGIAAAAAEAAAFEAELEPAPEVILDETPAAAAAVAAVDPGDMDMDDAMAWLEQLAARQGTSLDELPTVDASDLEKDVAAPDWITTAQEQAEEEALLAEEAVIEAVVEIEEEELTADAEVMLPDDMDMDDAMAWLEKLAARQGTPLNELPTVDAVPETDSDIDTPDWIAQQTGPLDESVIDSLNLPDVSDDVFAVDTDDDFFAALDEVPAIEGIEIGARSVSAPDMNDIDDSMPDWLSGGQESGRGKPLGHTGWLNTLDEPDMDGWLAAEAEATSSSDLSSVDMPKAVDTDSLLSTGGLEDTGSLYESKRKGDTGQLHFPGSGPRGSMFTSELDETQVFADLDLGDLGGGLDQSRLASARNGLAGGDIESALGDYQNLVEAGESMHTVISDLERASELHRDKPMVRRMLGDAYMRNGQINKAIETYREALDQM